MITPYFKLEQDEEFIIVTMRFKYVKIKEVEFFIENNNFRFSLKPYYLNLHFSDNILDSDKNSSKYDVENGIFTVKLLKETKGTIFKDLDLLCNLMNTNNDKNSNNLGKKIEEITESYEDIFGDIDEDRLNEMLVNQCSEKSENLIEKENYGYGFNTEFIDVFKFREEELMELADIDPSKIPVKQRYFERMKRENDQFIAERYMFDENDEEEEIDRLIRLKIEKWSALVNDMNSMYSEKEQTILLSLNKVKLSLFKEELYFEFYLEVLDIIFAFLYDLRITELEGTSESGWTINKISCVLSNFNSYKGLFFSNSDYPPFNFVEEAVLNMLIGAYRRVLIYPLYRSFKLCEKIKSDVIYFLSKGKTYILKLLLNVKIVLEKSEPRHMLNKIYIDFYSKWIQLSNDKVWSILLNHLKTIKINKKDLKLDLELIEEEFI